MHYYIQIPIYYYYYTCIIYILLLSSSLLFIIIIPSNYLLLLLNADWLIYYLTKSGRVGGIKQFNTSWVGVWMQPAYFLSPYLSSVCVDRKRVKLQTLFWSIWATKRPTTNHIYLTNKWSRSWSIYFCKNWLKGKGYVHKLAKLMFFAHLFHMLFHIFSGSCLEHLVLKSLPSAQLYLLWLWLVPGFQLFWNPGTGYILDRVDRWAGNLW